MKLLTVQLGADGDLIFAREARFGVPRRVGATGRIRRGELDSAFVDTGSDTCGRVALHSVLRTWAWRWTHASRPWLRLDRTNIDATTEHAVEAGTALVVIRRASKLRITCVNRRTPWQRQMRESRATIILQRTKQWIRIDLIAWTGQNAAAVIAANVVPARGDGAAIVNDVFA